jgi:hypothetical protein
MAMAEGKDQAAETPETSHWPHWLRFGRFSWIDLLVFAVAEGVAVPLNIAAGEAFVHRDLLGAAIGWTPGLPLFVFGIAFPFTRHWLKAETVSLLQRQAINWAPVAIVLAFAYVVGPNIYHRAIGSSTAVVTKEDFNSLKELEAQKATLVEWLQQAHRERDAARERAMDLDQQLGSMGLFTQKLGVIDLWAATNLYWGGKELINRLRKHNAALLVTAPPESEIFGDYVDSIINTSASILDVEHPEQKNSVPLLLRQPSETDLDAPKMPPPDFNGVVIHDGDEEILKGIEGLLNRIKRCVIVKTTNRTIEGVSEYYKRDVIWVEVGKWPLWNNTCV